MQTIVMDPVFGEVKIAGNSLCGSISIEGSGSVILPSSSTPLPMRLLHVDLPVPSGSSFSLHIDNFVVMNCLDLVIEIKFYMNTVDTLQGLHAYMNTMLNTNDEVIRF
jgi:hypothetical protein